MYFLSANYGSYGYSDPSTVYQTITETKTEVRLCCLFLLQF
jgi:hypothetical protein